MKRTLSIILTLVFVFSSFALWTITASADAVIVQDGLVSWFDGKDYEGTTWTDKMGNNDITDCVDGTFKDGAYVLDKAQQSLPNELYDIIRGDEFTVEMNLGEFETYPDTGYATWLCNNSGTTAEKVSFYIQLNKGATDIFKAKTSGIGSSARPAVDNATPTLQDATLTITFKAGGTTNVYVNGGLMATADSPAENANADVGSNPKFILGNAGVNNWSNTAFEGLRFYNRELTATEVKNNADVDNAPEPVGPAAITISPYDPSGLCGFQNWDGGNGMQTQLLICTTAPVDANYTWELTIYEVKTWEKQVINLKPSSTYEDWLCRFEVCLGEGDNQFIPEIGEEYTVSANIYNEAGELVIVAEAAAGFFCHEQPIVPEPPVVEPPVDPGEQPDTGDATVYAIVFATVALIGMGVVVTKKVKA